MGGSTRVMRHMFRRIIAGDYFPVPEVRTPAVASGMHITRKLSLTVKTSERSFDMSHMAVNKGVAPDATPAAGDPADRCATKGCQRPMSTSKSNLFFLIAAVARGAAAAAPHVPAQPGGALHHGGYHGASLVRLRSEIRFETSKRGF